MKTVTVRVVTSRPISLSKAAAILFRFTSSEIGVPQAVGAYLRRASKAFNELKSLHSELKPSSLKKRKPRSNDTRELENQTHVCEDSGRSMEVPRLKTHEERENDEAVDLGDNGGEIVGQERDSGTLEEKLSHDRRQVSQGPNLEEESEGKESKKKKKKKNKKSKEEDANGDDGKVTEDPKAGDKPVKMEIEEEQRDEDRKKKKKRKNDGEMGSDEKRSKKKKKSEGD